MRLARTVGHRDVPRPYQSRETVIHAQREDGLEREGRGRPRPPRCWLPEIGWGSPVGVNPVVIVDVALPISAYRSGIPLAGENRSTAKLRFGNV